jgi:sugar phosphate isomerase/epimerase
MLRQDEDGMKLSCADFTWPLLPHDKVLELIHLLDLEGVDIGFFGNRSHIRPEVVREDVALWAGILGERLARTQVELADLYYQPWSDFQTMAPNNPDAKQQAASDALFETVLEFGHRLKSPGITMLPGVRFGDESDEVSIRRSAEKLKQRVDQAARLGMGLSVEGHVGSNVDTPDRLARLVELTPGLTLTLDYTHYTFAGFKDSEMEPLIKYARHFQIRGAAKGKLQANFNESSIDHVRMMKKIKETGYDRWIGLEYVWINWQDCNRSENVSETIQLRDQVRAAWAGRVYEPAALSV